MPTYKTSLGTRADLELFIDSGTQQVGNNRTYVYYRLRIVRKGTGTASSQYANPYTVKINGSTVANSTSTYNTHNNATVTLASGNVWVNHNSDGKKTVAVSGTFRDLGGFLGGGTATKTVSGSPTLPTIPRSSTPRLSASSVAAGSSFTVYTDRASSSFTHTIDVTLGNYKISETGVGTSRSVTVVSSSALGQMSNVTSRNATVSLKTYNGSTLIGTKSTSISVTVPTNVTPTVGTLSVTETVSAVSNLGLPSGVLVSGVSRPRLRVTGSTAGTGSSISSQTLSFDGITTTTTDYTLSRDVRDSGTLPFKVTTRDARARSTSKTQNVTVRNYQAPTVSVNSSDRSTSAGVISNTGTYIKMALSGIVTSLMNGSSQKNTLQLKIESKLRGSADSTYVSNINKGISIPSNERWSATETFTRTGSFEGTKAYTLRITLTDKLRSSVLIHNISTAQIALHFDANLGVGIGKYREQGVLDVGGDIHTNGSLYLSGKRYNEVTMLASENLDNLIETGEYAQNLTANATPARNYPINVAGLLRVTRPDTGSMVYQSYQSYSSHARLFIRARYQGVWNPWREKGGDELGDVFSYYHSTLRTVQAGWQKPMTWLTSGAAAWTHDLNGPISVVDGGYVFARAGLVRFFMHIRTGYGSTATRTVSGWRNSATAVTGSSQLNAIGMAQYYASYTRDVCYWTERVSVGQTVTPWLWLEANTQAASTDNRISAEYVRYK